MKTFKSLAALEAAAKVSAKKTLNNQVKDLVEKKIKEKAQEVVYDSYSPVQYVRRHWLGTMFAIIPGNYSIRIYDIDPANEQQRQGTPLAPGYLAQMINDTGAPNVFTNGVYPWMGPRPFYKRTVEELNGSSELISVVRAGFLANI